MISKFMAGCTLSKC